MRGDFELRCALRRASTAFGRVAAGNATDIGAARPAIC
jgi:hypothetical protein